MPCFFPRLSFSYILSLLSFYKFQLLPVCSFRVFFSFTHLLLLHLPFSILPLTSFNSHYSSLSSAMVSAPPSLPRPRSEDSRHGQSLNGPPDNLTLEPPSLIAGDSLEAANKRIIGMGCLMKSNGPMPPNKRACKHLEPLMGWNDRSLTVGKVFS